jgi:transposase
VSTEYGVYLGLDVGKSDHHAVGLAPDGRRLHDAALPNTEVRLRALFDKLARHGRSGCRPCSRGAARLASPSPSTWTEGPGICRLGSI